MIRFLIHIGVNLVTVALGILLAAWLIDGVTLQPTGFFAAVAVLTLAQGILGPFVFNVARKHASAILGGIGLVSTLLALFIATLLPNGLTITGVLAWTLATLLVWVVTALGSWILGAILLRRARERRQNR